MCTNRIESAVNPSENFSLGKIYTALTTRQLTIWEQKDQRLDKSRSRRNNRSRFNETTILLHTEQHFVWFVHIQRAMQRSKNQSMLFVRLTSDWKSNKWLTIRLLFCLLFAVLQFFTNSKCELIDQQMTLSSWWCLVSLSH